MTGDPTPRMPGPAGAGSVELGGETACWLARVCPGCDAVLDAEPPAACPRCGRRVEPD